MDKKIPKIIHYCWFGGSELPEIAIKCINSWKKQCPEYKIIEWNEKNFDINYNNYVKEAYEEKKYAFVSDVARLVIVKKYGGIYLDIDVELIKPLDDFLDCDAFFSTEDNKVISTGLGFGACENNELIQKMLDDYNDIHFKKNGKLDLEPCPIRNTESIKNIICKFSNRNEICEYNNNFFYPKEYFCPIDNLSGEINVTNKTVSIHHFSGLWLSKKEIRINKNRRTICKIFGHKIGRKIANIYSLPHRINKKIKKIGIRKTILFTINKIKGEKK